ncbi:uncharacterized protein LOC126372890 [Pectinophora gossypiella]|uniref:uncharacterized protein LOC126372890 n=1 Tax=Pectinophora gossypiella TaxID=13191 RepID=UPI00214EA285|nr:uncharacterized protein LOC126372890 [Pectinophora gossypiella]XP_049874780.1 uncharacterized protein LOC126372890 [Pectinophora gossypiella]XP_049874781.1 uncharacterized protein LOC126372890 [Pectinophora gossypiella]
MAPGIHPPCTPSASCQSPRCHPTPPPCEYPEQCLANTTRNRTKPCQSALSIMATRARRGPCHGCGKFNGENTDNPRKVEVIQEYLARKSYEADLKRYDKLEGTHALLDYQRKIGNQRDQVECCAGKGHRGRVDRPSKKRRRKKKKRNMPYLKPPYLKRKKCKCTIL